MKNQLLPIALLLCLFFISCDNQDNSVPSNDSPPVITKPPKPNSTQDTIHLSTFNTYRNNWTAGNNAWISANSLEGFNFPLVDFKEVIGEDAVAARFYMGLKHLTGLAGTYGTAGNYEAKLMVVGLNASNEPMINYANGHYVYDVSLPCPPCDPIN